MSLSTDYGSEQEAKGIIEELFIHEGAHASLDGHHANVGLFSNLSIVSIQKRVFIIPDISLMWLHIDRLANGYAQKMMTGNSSLPTLVIIQREKMSLKVFCHGLQ